MIKQYTVLDAWTTWAAPSAEAAAKRGYDAKIVGNGNGASGRAGLAFIRPHAAPKKVQSMKDDTIMRGAAGVVMVQDRAQVEVFENKGEQFRRWGQFMPPTWRCTNRQTARATIESLPPEMVLVFKADEGASSSNVHVVSGRRAQHDHAHRIFTRGVRVRHCGGFTTLQKNYVMFQRYIPHTVTWRVNLIGSKLAIFRRFNYPDRPVAQTGNVEPVMELTDEIHDLLAYAAKIGEAIGSKWVALDILRDNTGDKPAWVLLETSLGWPWPSPGDCDSAPFFMLNGGRYSRADYEWRTMWELMLDEYEAGVFGAC